MAVGHMQKGLGTGAAGVGWLHMFEWDSFKMNSLSPYLGEG